MTEREKKHLEKGERNKKDETSGKEYARERWGLVSEVTDEGERERERERDREREKF